MSRVHPCARTTPRTRAEINASPAGGYTMAQLAQHFQEASRAHPPTPTHRFKFLKAWHTAFCHSWPVHVRFLLHDAMAVALQAQGCCVTCVASAIEEAPNFGEMKSTSSPICCRLPSRTSHPQFLLRGAGPVAADFRFGTEADISGLSMVFYFYYKNSSFLCTPD